MRLLTACALALFLSSCASAPEQKQAARVERSKPSCEVMKTSQGRKYVAHEITDESHFYYDIDRDCPCGLGKQFIFNADEFLGKYGAGSCTTGGVFDETFDGLYADKVDKILLLLKGEVDHSQIAWEDGNYLEDTSKGGRSFYFAVRHGKIVGTVIVYRPKKN